MNPPIGLTVLIIVGYFWQVLKENICILVVLTCFCKMGPSALRKRGSQLADDFSTNNGGHSSYASVVAFKFTSRPRL